MHPKSVPSFFHEGRSLTSYLRTPMGIAGSPNIFQAKMSELMVALKFMRT
jgi:hypothetical protein